MKPTEYCCGFLFSAGKMNVALVQKLRPDWQEGRINGIGGHVEPGETPHEAMVREFREETGLLVPEWRKLCVLSPAKKPEWRVHFFTQELKVGEPSMLKSITDEQVSWMPKAPTPKHLPNLRWLVPMAYSLLEGKDKATSFIVTEIYE